MSAEDSKLSADIDTAEKRVAELEAQSRKLAPLHRQQVEHQIKHAKHGIRDMRITLAGMQDHRDIPCRHCGTLITHSFTFCRACIRELPLKFYAHLKGAIGYLKQHSTAIV